jgi:GNAT superfamily N-acetyltransferase
MCRACRRGILVATPDRRRDASQHRRHVVLTVSALETPRPGAPLAPAGVEAWLAHSAANNAEYWELPVRRMGRPRARWDDAWAADPGLANPYPNSATLLRPMTAESVGDLLERLNGFYDSAPGGPWILWSPWATPDLRSRGFIPIGQPPLMVLPPRGFTLPEPAGLEIVEVEDGVTLDDWQRVLVEGYPAPELRDAERPFYDPRVLGGPLRLWVGYAGGRPVSCASAFLDEEAIGVYAVATVPEARGRGYGAALTDRAATCVPSLPAWLTASELGWPVYARLGFVEVARYTLWVKGRAR